ncbi:hypothetical protein EVAR_23847_1 [Eumeta japonica]|uniref:Uncharacterized protein n=1 Tax=Eumeta variegata TaxID=151549 RepID=A0A4C1V5E1_EUMVA|nr:hypothetical protein EVAR_23847_1 [Eumeta japonica]
MLRSCKKRHEIWGMRLEVKQNVIATSQLSVQTTRRRRNIKREFRRDAEARRSAAAAAPAAGASTALRKSCYSNAPCRRADRNKFVSKRYCYSTKGGAGRTARRLRYAECVVRYR